MSNTKLVIGLLAGTAIGASVGLLMAPEKGKTARKKILREGKKYSKSFNKSVDDVLHSVSKKINEISKETDQLISKAKSNGKELASSATSK